MVKALYVGDPHCTADSIDEMERLIDLVIASALEAKVDYVCFLGDQTNNHSVLHLSVMSFWDRAFKRMQEAGVNVIALVGNHDKSGVTGIEENSMMLYKNITVISKPVMLHNILFCPYVADPVEFVNICKANPTHTVVCHVTIQGMWFENGFEIEEGVNPDDIPQQQILSGHIHKPSQKGKTWYIGAPRWRSVSDANTERHIVVVGHATSGEIISTKLIPTAGACRPMYALQDSAEEPVQMPEIEATVVVDVHGTKEYVDRRKAELEASYPGIRIRTFAEADRVVRVKESDGVHVAMKKFIGEFKSKNGTPPEELWKMASSRISWLKNV